MITAVPDVPGKYLIQVVVTVIWLLGLANAVNFLDGIDGLVCSMSAVCAMIFFLIGWHTRQSYLAYLTIAIAGACVGFIPYNWRPASVYLGDAGATFLGFMLGGIAVMGTWAHNDPIIALSTPLLILGIPIFDMIYTTVSRINNGSVRTFKQWLEFAGRDHFHHRLMNLGLSVPQSVFFILLLNVCLGLGAMVMRGTDTMHCILLGVQGVLVFVIIVVLMIRGAELGRGSDGE
jgi:UDP-GlcNAc:undecaprenyl-phosphate GlcNAc-1-phosphate transferase